MGRQSPGKWIRNLFLGKKSSKSKSSKEKDIYKPSSNKDVLVVSSGAFISCPTVISPPTTGANATKEVLSEKEVISVSSNEGAIRYSPQLELTLPSEAEKANAQNVANFGSEDHHDKIRLTEAAITAQAAIRGYQARTKFQTLKCITPLQAHIRGQLVRRQAVCALYCVKAIVKFQALVRGYMVRHSAIGLEVQKICKNTKCSNSTGEVTSTQAAKLSDNIFFNKVLLASSPSSVSAYLKCNPEEPNLAWDWLDRWTKSHFWAPLTELKKPDSINDKEKGSCQTLVTNEGQVKRKSRKSSPVKVVDNSVSDSKNHKRCPKKDSNLPVYSGKEHSLREHQKRSFKKAQSKNVSDKSEVSVEKKTHITRKDSDHTVNDIQEKGPSASSEKTNDLSVSMSKQSDLEKSLGQKPEEHNNESCIDTNPILQPSFMNGNGGVIEDLNVDDNCIKSENSKNCQRRASLPANFMDHENLLHNTPKLPSYMAPTESTKAKLRAQGSPQFTSDMVDRNSITRRLSLSSSLNGKFGSFSPRADRMSALSNKGMIRTDRSLSSSRDGTDKLIQPQWRR